LGDPVSKTGKRRKKKRKRREKKGKKIKIKLQIYKNFTLKLSIVKRSSKIFLNLSNCN